MRSAAIELPLTADRASSLPLAGQLAGQLREAIADGLLGAGERLPATRELAGMLGVSRTVVTGAYAQLFAEGWIEGRQGSGTYVAPGAPGGRAARVTAAQPGPRKRPGRPGPPGGEVAEHQSQPGRTPLIDMRPGRPWAAGIDRAAWRRAWRSAGAQPPGAVADPCGLGSLRAALTGYLRRARGVRCPPEQVLLTRGVAGSLGLIAAALLEPGDPVGVEEPGYPAAHAVFAARGARVVPCRVDADGLVVRELPPGLKLIYATPAHQYPLGGRLPVPRRRALIDWARATGALVVEDDYDGEFRYDVGPLPALFGLDPEVVIYLGTTAKTLAPTLRLGWVAAPAGRARALAAAAGELGDWPAEPVQRAVLSLVAGGDLERHIRRMRHEYARRRAVLTAALGGMPGTRLLGDEAGMHVALEIGPDAAAVAAAARERGVAVATLERYHAGPVTRNALLIGYGGVPLPDLARGCQILAAILAGPAGRGPGTRGRQPGGGGISPGRTGARIAW